MDLDNLSDDELMVWMAKPGLGSDLKPDRWEWVVRRALGILARDWLERNS